MDAVRARAHMTLVIPASSAHAFGLALEMFDTLTVFE
jgi:hypothetical protein